MAVTDQNFQDAAQYAFDNYLSKPYTNESVKFDWDYKAEDGTVINRPNHGLAHSFRGANYAPVVCSYFKNFAKDKQDFQFSDDEIKKIQIALMFRVAGRENDGGFTDDPDAYRRYQKNHGEAFKQYCNDNPGIFTAEEVEKYADALQTYAVPGQNDPLKTILKACHNIDLIRCCNNERMERELEPIRAQIGDHTEDLVVYADACIRQTGTRVQDNNPITGKPKTRGYDEEKFVSVSKDVKACAKEVSSVPTPADIYYRKAQAVKRNPLKQAEYVNYLEMASKLGHSKAQKSLNRSIYNFFSRRKPDMDTLPGSDMTVVLGHTMTLGAVKPSLGEIDQINDNWEKADALEEYGNDIVRKLNFCKNLLNDDMALPNPFTIKFDNKTYKGDKALQILSDELAKFSSEMNQVLSGDMPKYKKQGFTDSLHDLAFLSKAISEQAPDNKKVQKNINGINEQLAIQKIEPKNQQDVNAEKVKNAFLTGQGQKAESLAAEASKAQEKENTLAEGPLNKNVHTYRYEQLMHDFLSGEKYTLEKRDDNFIVKFGESKEYNVTEILKYANLNHLEISEQDAQSYMAFLATDEAKYPPHKPNEAKPKVPTKLSSVAEMSEYDKGVLDSNPELASMMQAERMAINIYSTGFYRPANSMLRGGDISEKEIKELICTTGMAVAGLNKIDEEKPVNTFRAEKDTPDEVLKSRVNAAENGGVTIESGFISSAMDKPDTSFGFKNTSDTNVGVVFQNLVGKNINAMSAFPGEREFLIPPTQVAWQHHVNVHGGHIFTARPAATPTGLEQNALQGITEEQRQQFDQQKKESKVEQQVAEQLPDNQQEPQSLASSGIEQAQQSQALKSQAPSDAHQQIPPTRFEGAQPTQANNGKVKALTFFFEAKAEENSEPNHGKSEKVKAEQQLDTSKQKGIGKSEPQQEEQANEQTQNAAQRVRGKKG